MTYFNSALIRAAANYISHYHKSYDDLDNTDSAFIARLFFRSKGTDLESLQSFIKPEHKLRVRHDFEIETGISLSNDFQVKEYTCVFPTLNYEQTVLCAEQMLINFLCESINFSKRIFTSEFLQILSDLVEEAIDYNNNSQYDPYTDFPLSYASYWEYPICKALTK